MGSMIYQMIFRRFWISLDKRIGSWRQKHWRRWSWMLWIDYLFISKPIKCWIYFSNSKLVWEI